MRIEFFIYETLVQERQAESQPHAGRCARGREHRRRRHRTGS